VDLAETYGTHREDENIYKMVVVKLEGKRLTGRSRWGYNIKTDLKDTGHFGVDWIQLAVGKVQWQALMNRVMNLRVI
jgi:hypothetical protein